MTTKIEAALRKVREKAPDIAKRAAKTFLKAFIASIPIDAATLAGGWNVWRATLLSAAAAGLSAVMNAAIAALEKEESDVHSGDETGEG